MVNIVFNLLGGIGLFLLGMVLLTDGLKASAGEALRRSLMRFTGTPVKAFASGVLVTAMIQSSTATTVTVIGFVSAGLLTFPQAIGVVMGASLGTTGTGWFVAMFGLKISLGFYALPLVGIGAFLRLLTRGKWRSIGMALAGFGLIFVGIDTLQVGMKSVSGIFNFAEIPFTGFWAHVLIMIIGIGMTFIMQSSTAAVATTLTALHSGAVNFEQAASLVIGAAIGTTLTGALAVIGGSVPAKRTALAHVSFNLGTGLVAIVLLPLFLFVIGQAQIFLGLPKGAVSLAAFHTLFIGFGVVVVLPFISQFSEWIERTIPDRGPALTKHLDDTLLNVPAVALEATRRVLLEVSCELFKTMSDAISGQRRIGDADRIVRIESALHDLQRFFAKIPPVGEDETLSKPRVAQLHVIDHLFRLGSHHDINEGMKNMLSDPRLKTAVDAAVEILDLAEAGLHGRLPADWIATLQQRSSALAALRKEERPKILEGIASGQAGSTSALEMLDVMRWLDRVGYHVWRICHHLGGTTANNGELIEEHQRHDDFNPDSDALRRERSARKADSENL